MSEVAISFLESQLGVKSNDILVKTTTESSAAKHAYVQQKLNGIPVANAVANVALSKANKILAFGSSFVKPSKQPLTSMRQHHLLKLDRSQSRR